MVLAQVQVAMVQGQRLPPLQRVGQAQQSNSHRPLYETLALHPTLAMAEVMEMVITVVAMAAEAMAGAMGEAMAMITRHTAAVEEDTMVPQEVGMGAMALLTLAGNPISWFNAFSISFIMFDCTLMINVYLSRQLLSFL